jgi:glutathione S-transferase
VLVEGDEIVFDSPRVVEWLERRHPEQPLYPREPARRAEVQLFVDWFNQLWKRPPNLIAAELERPEPDAGRIEELGLRMRVALDVFESLLEGRDYLYGEFGVADVVAFPFLKYAAFGLPPGDDELFHRVLVEHMPLGDEYPQLRRWSVRVDAHARS